MLHESVLVASVCKFSTSVKALLGTNELSLEEALKLASVLRG